MLPVGIADDMAALHRILRARAEELDISREALDIATGLQKGYCAKLLAPIPSKGLGYKSLGRVLGALGLCLVVCEVPGRAADIPKRTRKRTPLAMARPDIELINAANQGF
jgi:hypothetical protein